jgi:hypothetical protein
MDMTGEALSGMRFGRDGDTLGLWCDREPGTGVWVTAVRSGLTGPGLAGKVREHEQGHGCSPEAEAPSGPDHAARAAGLEAELRAIRDTATSPVTALSAVEALGAIGRRAARALGLPEGSTEA